MTIDEIRKKKEESGYSLNELARRTGVPFATIQKILSGTTKSPRYETMLKLSAVLSDEPGSKASGTFSGSQTGDGACHCQPVRTSLPACSGDRSAAAPFNLSAPSKEELLRNLREDSVGQQDGTPCILRESPEPYGSAASLESPREPEHPADRPFGGRKQGEYTVDDYLNLTDDKRYELIDGVLYDMSPPTKRHQMLVGYLYHQLMICRDQHQGSCMPYVSPLDVQLDRDNKTMVQPDVIVNCDPEKELGPRLFGAPDFLAEVLSPSTSLKDRYTKLAKYKAAGVREFWIIDPDTEKVIVYLFHDDGHDEIHLYTFEDAVPVDISGGMCRVKFADMH